MGEQEQQTSSEHRISGWIKFGLPLLLIFGSIGIAAVFILTRPEPPRAEDQFRGMLVSVERVERETISLDVLVQGTAKPAKQVAIRPQVAGKVVRQHPQLMPGGLVEEGDLLYQIERDDFEIALRQSRSALKEAEARLRLEKGQHRVAQEEWELFKQEVGEERGDRELALRLPQLQTAEAAVESARARLDKAELDLVRTSVEAPFNGFILEENVDLGQLVAPENSTVRLVGTDVLWVQAAVPVEKLPFINVPGVNAQEGSQAWIRHDLGARTLEWTGRVERLQGELDPAGRMARLLVTVEDPFRRKTMKQPEHGVEPADSHEAKDHALRGLPLLVGAYLDVRIKGNRERPLIRLSRRHLRGGNKAYVMGKDNQLDIRELEIVWENPGFVLVGNGLSEGEKVVTSALATAVQGMLLRAEENVEEGRQNEMEEGPDSARGIDLHSNPKGGGV